MKELSLDEVKKIQLNILKYVDHICIANDIKYSLAYGTLLGAVRHGGFIPWDDDIDIVLLREEYDKLLDVLYKDNNDIFEIFSPKDKGYFYNYAKVTDKRTIITEKNWPQIEGLGVNIDIFPLDYLPENEPEKFFKKVIFYDNCLKNCLTNIAFCHDKWYMRGLKYICRIAKVKKCRDKSEWYWKDKVRELCNNRKSSKIACVVAEPYRLWDANLMEKYTRLLFEGTEFQVTEDYRTMLEQSYENYMELPPEEERKSNHDFIPYWK